MRLALDVIAGAVAVLYVRREILLTIEVWRDRATGRGSVTRETEG